MGRRTEVDFHMRMSRSLHAGLRAIAEEQDTALAEFLRRELWRIVTEHQARNVDLRPPIPIDPARRAISGTGAVPDRYRRR